MNGINADRFYLVSIRKGGIFRPGQEIKGLRGGVHRYAAQFCLLNWTAKAPEG
jgi:hypothetical protein